LRAEFSKYGAVEDIFIKPGCEPGRQWAFVTYASYDMALHAAEQTNGTLQFPGSIRPCEVSLARNQGMFGQNPITPLGKPLPVPAPVSIGRIPLAQVPAPMPLQSVHADGPKKIFVGSLPDSINEMMLRAEFSKYGQITDVFIKTGCETGRQWAFVTFATPDQAHNAKVSCNHVLNFPGSERPSEVTLARHQGLFGQDALPTTTATYANGAIAPHPVLQGPRKVFVGSLPDNTTESALMAEFSKYGQVTDVFLKQGGGEPCRRWGFITFTSQKRRSMPMTAQIEYC